MDNALASSVRAGEHSLKARLWDDRMVKDYKVTAKIKVFSIIATLKKLYVSMTS